MTMNYLLNVLMGLKSFLKVSYLLVSQVMHDLLLEVRVIFLIFLCIVWKLQPYSIILSSKVVVSFSTSTECDKLI